MRVFLCLVLVALALTGTFGKGRKKRANGDTFVVPPNAHYNAETLIDETRPSITSQIIDEVNKVIYVASSDLNGGVWKIPFYTCEAFTSCDTCLASNDPYCGWCTLSASCTDSAGCSSVWRQGSTQQCPTMAIIGETSVPTNGDPHPFELNVTNVETSAFDGGFRCTFNRPGNVTINVPATRLGAELFRCDLPTIQSPLITPQNEQVSISLGYLFTDAILLTLPDAITLTDCAVFTTCSDCQTSSIGCGWCVTDRKCYATAVECSIPTFPGFQPLGSCAYISNVLPKWIPLGGPTTVSVSVVDIPNIANGGFGNFSCRFTSTDDENNFRESYATYGPINFQNFTTITTGTGATITGSAPPGTALTLTCPMPYGLESQATCGSDRFRVSFRLSTPTTEYEFAASNTNSIVAMYDCSTATSCQACTALMFGGENLCGWDARASLCTPLVFEDLFNQLVRLGAFCPSLTSISPSVISAGVQQSLFLAGQNFGQPDFDLNYFCRFSSGQTTLAEWINQSSLRCNTPSMATDTSGVLIGVELKVVYGSLELEGPYPLTFLNCPMYTNQGCDACFTLFSTYGEFCGWCKEDPEGSPAHCSTIQRCNSRFGWLASPGSCPPSVNPTVTLSPITATLPPVTATLSPATVTLSPSTEIVTLNPATATVTLSQATTTVTLNPATATVTLSPETTTVTLNPATTTITLSQATQIVTVAPATNTVTVTQSTEIVTFTQPAAVETVTVTTTETLSFPTATVTIGAPTTQPTATASPSTGDGLLVYAIVVPVVILSALFSLLWFRPRRMGF